MPKHTHTYKHTHTCVPVRVVFPAAASLKSASIVGFTCGLHFSYVISTFYHRVKSYVKVCFLNIMLCVPVTLCTVHTVHTRAHKLSIEGTYLLSILILHKETVQKCFFSYTFHPVYISPFFCFVDVVQIVQE